MKTLNFFIAFAVYVAANTHAASDICSVTTCKSSSGLECDRTSEECPICLSKDDSNGDVYCVDTFIRICPIGSTRCRTVTSPSPVPSDSSASSSGSKSESSGSGSGSPTPKPKPTKKTPKPTSSPSPSPSLSPSLSPLPSPNTDSTTIPTQEPRLQDNNETNSAPVSSGSEKKSSGPSIGLIVGIVSAVVVVVGAIVIALWKKKNEYDDSDDEEEYHPTYRPPVAGSVPEPAPAPADTQYQTMNAPYGVKNSYRGNDTNNYNASQVRSNYGYVPPAPVDYRTGRDSALMRNQENSSDMPLPGRYRQPDALESGLESRDRYGYDVSGNNMESSHHGTKNNNNGPVGRSESSSSVEF